MSTTRKLAARYKVGEWVSFLYGTRRVWAQIIEDRGSLGVGGRRIYRIRLGDEPTGEGAEEPLAFELPEDDLVAARPEPAAVIKYLKDGGLLAILQSNLGGGRPNPRAWLTFDPQGRIVHTFNKHRGLIGGELVPFFALQGYHVFTPKVDEVIEFLSRFGLSRSDAQQVIQAVGTSP
jgi:hypothetical protein